MILLKIKISIQVSDILNLHIHIKAIAGRGFAHAATILQIQLAHARTLHLN